MMTAGILRIPEAPLVRLSHGQTFWRMLSEPFRDRPYVWFLLFGALFNLAAAMAGPFALRCMKSTLGAGDNFVVWMDTVASAGAAATLPLWGRIVDRFGGRTIFALLVPSLALVNLLWLFADPMDPHWQIVVATFYLLQGVLAFGIGVGITDMMLGSARDGNQSAYINMAFVLNTLAAGVGPFLGTLVAGVFADINWQWGVLILDATRWVFIFRFFLMLVSLSIVGRLSREHGGHVGEALQRLTAGLLNLLPSIRGAEGAGRSPLTQRDPAGKLLDAT
jgi:MFS family permease